MAVSAAKLLGWDVVTIGLTDAVGFEGAFFRTVRTTDNDAS